MPVNKKSKQVYDVEEILDQAVINNEPHYLIKWLDWPHQFDTWEPISSLGNISAYLKYWLEQRRKKQQKSKEKQHGAHFQTFKHLIDREHLQPKKKSVRQQYADQEQLEKKKLKRERYGEKLLKRKKTWEKYLQYDRCHVDLVDDDDQQEGKHQNHQELYNHQYNQQSGADNRINQNKYEKMEEQINQKKQYSTNTKKEETKPMMRIEEQKPKLQNQAAKPKEPFKVIGLIDPLKIRRICKFFSFKGINCAQVQYQDGRRLNMKLQEIQLTNPKLLQHHNNLQNP